MGKLNLEAELNEPQLRAVKTLEGPVLIIAGAGSGKTRVITCRIAHMLEQGIPQPAILALTFTNKAAREMEHRVRELTGKRLQNLTVSTFHAFGVKILREEIGVLGYRDNFSIYDETDRNQLIKDSLRECRFSLEGVDLYALGQLFSNVKIGRFRWEGEDAVYGPVYREYQHSLKVFNALDFDDLLTLPIQIFTEYPAVLEKYRRRYRYIMVDEFQDTSLIQYRLMKLLAAGPDRAGGETDGLSGENASGLYNVCVVGDDDQSIYSWRGASYENLLRFERDFPGAAEIKLEQNYRSTTTILEAANGVISHNANRKEKQLWSGNTGGKPIELVSPENENEEARFIVSQIKRLRFQEGLKNGDFGVLIRTNAMTRAIEEAFLEANIPYRVSGGTSFFQRKEIKDILSYLRVIANENDDVNLLRIINTPRRGIGKNLIAQIAGLARKNNSPLWDAMGRLRFARDSLFQGTVSARAEINDFMTLIEFFKEEMLTRGGSLSAKTRALTDNIDYHSYLISEHGKNEKIARWKFLNIENLLQSIENWEKDPDNMDRSLYAYLNRISLLTRDEGDDEGEKDKVNLMTIHAAKGLEFPVVFIAGAEDGIIPHERSLEEGGNMEEERRLFYVAITRARDKLYISNCLKRRRLQDTVDCVPSPYLAEIPQHLIQYSRGEEVVENPGEVRAYFALMRSRFS
ncbi:MAG: UvrD-helicase domain-containing protein [Treponema sp.]|jgi:DNA helicase-2/ATP-dependent DNA helicase PcrA|nr:UvrD-helicase domain-containing protein [Treponema sp.]